MDREMTKPFIYSDYVTRVELEGKNGKLIFRLLGEMVELLAETARLTDVGTDRVLINALDEMFTDLELYQHDPSAGIYGPTGIMYDLQLLRTSENLGIPASELCPDCMVKHEGKCPLVEAEESD